MSKIGLAFLQVPCYNIDAHGSRWVLVCLLKWEWAMKCRLKWKWVTKCRLVKEEMHLTNPHNKGNLILVNDLTLVLRLMKMKTQNILFNNLQVNYRKALIHMKIRTMKVFISMLAK